MSGIIIDVESGAPKATQEVQKLSDTLNKTIQTSAKAATRFQSFDSRAIVNLQKQVLSLQSQMGSLNREANTTTGGLTTGATVATAAMGKLGSAIKLAGSAFVAFKATSGLHKVTDDLTQVANRLAIISDSSQEILRRQTAIYGIAKATRTEMGGTADLVVSFTRSLERIGIAEGRVNSLVTTIQQAGALSGSSVEGLRGAILQLNQGISSGTLRGEELNSVLEQMSYLGVGLQRELGMNAGQLRKFAEAGKLTSELLVTTLEKMAAKTAADFAKTSATVDQAATRLGGAIKYMIADTNRFYGVSERFAKRLLWSADKVDEFNASLLASSVGMRRAATEYLHQFDKLSAVKLTVNTALQLKMGPIDLYERYKLYKNIKSGLATARGWVAAMRTPQIEVPASVSFTGVKGVDGFTNSLRDTAMGINRTTTLAAEFKLTMLAFADSFRTTASSLGLYAPRVLLPVKGYFDQLKVAAKTTKFDVLMARVTQLLPIARKLEAVSETLSGGLFNDYRVARAYVNVFQSKGIREFRVNLEALNKARKSYREDDPAFILKEAAAATREALRPIQNFGIAIGVLENRFVSVSFSKTIRRFVNDLETYRRVVERVYSDILYPKLAPALFKLETIIDVYGQTMLKSLAKRLTYARGYQLGKQLADGLAAAIKAIGRSVQSIFAFKFEFLFSESGETVGGRMARGIFAGLKILGNWLDGLFNGFYDRMAAHIDDISIQPVLDKLRKAVDTLAAYAQRVGDSLARVFKIPSFNLSAPLKEAAIDMGRLFGIMAELAASGLAKVWRIIADFAKRVKREFFMIYDDVVGHSTWPDLIDGIVNYTDNVWAASSKLDEFGLTVKRIFSNLMKSIDGTAFGAVIQKLVAAFGNVNWSGLGEALRLNLGAAIIAAIVFAFGGTTLKIASAHFFVSVFGNAFKGAFDTIMPNVGATVGQVAGHLGAIVRDSLLNSIELIGAAIVPFAKGFVGEFAGAFAGVLAVATSVPQAITGLLGGVKALGIMSAVGLVWALAVSGGFKQVWQMIVGEAASKGKAAKIGFIQAFMGLQSPGGGILSKLFAEPKAAVLAGLAFGTSLLEGVSMIEASSIGVPLLLSALLGQDGAVRIRNGIWDTVKAGAASASVLIAKTAGEALGKPTLFLDIFKDPVSDFMGPLKPPKKLATFAESVKGTLAAIIDNRDGFGRGKMSFDEMLTKGSKDNLSRWFSEQSKITKVYGVTIENIFKQVGITARKISGTIVDAWDFGQVVAHTRSSAGQAGGAWTLVFQGLAQNAVNLAKPLLASLYKYRIAIVGIGALLLSTFATAGPSYMQELSSAGLEFSATMGVAVAATLALGAGLAAVVHTFKTMRSAQALAFPTELRESVTRAASAKYVQEVNRLVADASLASQNAVKASYDKHQPKLREAEAKAPKKDASPLEQATYNGTFIRPVVRERDKEIAAARKKIEKELGKEKAAAADLRDAEIKAAQTAAYKAAGLAESSAATLRASFKALIGDYVEMARSGLAHLKLLVTSPRQALESLKESLIISTGVPNALLAMPAATDRVTKSVAALSASSVFFKDGQVVRGIGQIVIAAYQMSAAFFAASVAAGKFAVANSGGLLTVLGSSLKTLGKVGTGALFLLASGLKMAMSAMLGLLGVSGPLLAVGAAVGALWLAFFGPGNTFFDKLQWAYDTVRGIFGLEAKTNFSKELNISTAFKSVEVGKDKASVNEELAWLDFDKLSAKQVEVLVELGKTTGEGFARLEAEFVKNGKLTEAQRKEFSQLQRERSEVLARQPALADKTLQGRFDEGKKDLSSVDVNLGSRLRRLFGMAANSAAPKAKPAERLPEFGKWLLKLAVMATSLETVTSVTEWLNRTLKAVNEGFKAFVDFVRYAYAGLESFNRGLVALAVVIGGAIGAILAPVLGTAAAVGLLVGAFAGLVGGGYLAKFSDWVLDLRDKLRVKMEGKPTAQQAIRGANYEKENAKVLKYGEFIAPEIRKLIISTDLEATKAQRKADLLEGTSVATTSPNQLKDRQKKIAEFAALAQQKRDFAKYLKEGYGDYAEETSYVKKYSEAMATLAKDTQTYLGLDIGALGEKFKGNTDQLERLKKLNTAAAAKAFDLTRTKDPESVRRVQTDLEDLQKQGQALMDEAASSLKFEMRVDIQATTLGISKEDLARMAAVDPSTFAAFDTYAQTVTNLQAEIAKLGTADAGQFTKLNAMLKSAQAAAQGLVTTGKDFESLSKGLSEMGASDFSMDKMVHMNKEGIDKMAGFLDEYKQKKLQLANIAEGPDAFRMQIEKLQELLNIANKVKSALAGSTAEAAQKILDGPGSTIAKSLLLNSVGADQAPASVARSESSLAKYNKLATAKLTAQAQIAQAVATGIMLTDEEAASAQKALYATHTLTEQMGKLSEVRKVTVEALFSALSSAGVEVTMLEFAKMGGAMQKAFAAVGGQLEMVQNRISEMSASAAGSAALSKLLSKQAALIDQAALLASKNTISTGEKVTQALSDLGVEAVHKLSVATVQSLMANSRAANLLASANKKAFDTGNSQDVAAYLDRLKKAAKGTFDLRQETERLARSFDGDMGNINEMFGVSLERIDLSRMGKQGAGIAGLALELKQELEKALDEGGPRLNRALERVDLAKLEGQFLQLSIDFGRSLRASLTEGTMAGFERVKAQFGEMSFDSYATFDSKERSQLSVNAAQFEQMEKYLEMPMNPGMLNALKGLGDGSRIGEVIADFEAAAAGLLKPDLTPLQQRLESDKAVVIALDNLAAAFNAKLPEMTVRGSATPDKPVEGVKESLRPEAQTFRDFAKLKAEAAGDVRATQVGRLSSSAGLREMMPDISAMAALLATPKQTSEAQTLGYARQQAQIGAAGSEGDQKTGFLAAVDVYNEAIKNLGADLMTNAERVVNAGTRIREAGVSMTEDIKTGANNAINGLLRGQADEDSSVLATFANSMLDTISGSIVDNMSKGLVDGLFSAPLEGVTKKLGESIFSGMSNLFSGSDLLGDIDFGSMFGGLIDGIKGAFSGIDFGSMFTKLLSFLPFANGGYVSGPGTGTSDSIPASLSNGEFVVRASATKRHLPLLKAINGGYSPQFANGGLVQARPLQMLSTVSHESLSPTGGSTSMQEININITGDISRQTKSEIYKMLPQITAGVNSQNKEQNYN